MDWKKQIAKSYDEITKCNYLGLRATRPDENYRVGDYARNSYDWDFENDCSSDDELNGTCTVSLNNSWLEDADDLIERIEDRITAAEAYCGKNIVLLGGDRKSYGDDPNEYVIENARVLAIIK